MITLTYVRIHEGWGTAEVLTYNRYIPEFWVGVLLYWAAAELFYSPTNDQSLTENSKCISLISSAYSITHS